MNYYRGRTTSTLVGNDDGSSPSTTPDVQKQLEHCSRVVSQALMARAMVYIQGGDKANALKDLAAAVAADSSNDVAAEVLESLVVQQHTSATAEPAKATQLTATNIKPQRVVETGYIVASFSKWDVQYDDVIGRFKDDELGMHLAIRQACRVGECDPTQRETYYGVGRDPEPSDWKWVKVYRMFSVRQEILTMNLNPDCDWLWDQPLPKWKTAPLLNCRSQGIPRGKWHHSFQWLDEKDSEPPTNPFSMLCQIEEIIERLVHRKKPILEGLPSVNNNSPHDTFENFCDELTNNGEAKTRRQTWRQLRTEDSEFADSVECGLHELLDDVRTEVERFLAGEATPDSDHNDQLLTDAELFACEFLREHSIPEDTVPEDTSNAKERVTLNSTA